MDGFYEQAETNSVQWKSQSGLCYLDRDFIFSSAQKLTMKSEFV